MKWVEITPGTVAGSIEIRAGISSGADFFPTVREVFHRTRTLNYVEGSVLTGSIKKSMAYGWNG